jgi:hypothetical protein
MFGMSLPFRKAASARCSDFQLPQRRIGSWIAKARSEIRRAFFSSTQKAFSFLITGVSSPAAFEGR